MTDPRNINHDKKVADERHDQDKAAVQPQPGRKAPQVDAGAEPSNSRASEMYKDGELPREKSGGK